MPIVENTAALLPHWPSFDSTDLAEGGPVRIGAATTSRNAKCPGCGVTSARVHSRYVRRLVDAAIGGREALVALRVRRFLLRPARLCEEDLR